MTELKPGATIGILGGGQLGRMLALAAARLGRTRLIDNLEFSSGAGDDAGERQRRLRTAEDGDRSARSRRCGGQVEDVVARGAAAVDAMGAHSVGVCQGCDVRLRR